MLGSDLDLIWSSMCQLLGQCISHNYTMEQIKKSLVNDFNQPANVNGEISTY